ncbi:hypothetical protein BV22DRAFT_1041588 [Leucogyrophana mollusca]|uniref:Uncharacterized protein n=1 Tax=Leucogyrophana mollusca TaxID=85980 RepID=A0ACB8B0L9_9AGAM|nr:hypothetical protein BV22DRAFT_1041588 [Leucogyrophana mollusca]
MRQSRQTAVVDTPLGSASNYPAELLMRRKPPKGSFRIGELYLRVTIDELEKMVPKGRQPHMGSTFEKDISSAKERYDLLMLEKDDIENALSSMNPWKRFWEGRRESRRFMEAAEILLRDTQTTSDMIKRACTSIPSTEISPVADGSVGPDERVSGVALNGPFNDELVTAMSGIASFVVSRTDIFTDPFADGAELSVDDAAAGSSNRSMCTSTGASSSDVGWSASTQPEVPSTSSGTRPMTQNFYLMPNSIIAGPNSTVSNPTLNNGGKYNRGGIVYQQVVIPSEPPDNNTSPPLTASLCELAVGDNDTLQISG